MTRFRSIAAQGCDHRRDKAVAVASETTQYRQRQRQNQHMPEWRLLELVMPAGRSSTAQGWSSGDPICFALRHGPKPVDDQHSLLKSSSRFRGNDDSWRGCRQVSAIGTYPMKEIAGCVNHNAGKIEK